MAALGKIRSKGGLLIAIIGLGLFSFIAEEAFRSCESTRNDARQQVGEVLGEKINVQDYQKLLDEYTEVIKTQQGQENLNEDQMNQVKDMVWNTYVQSKIYEKETKKLGLTVTDEELENILNEGTNPMLLQTPFVNQQTRRFDVNQLKQFLAEYKNQQKTNPQIAEQYRPIYRYWTFLEKTLRQQTLVQKYQSLFASCLISNPVEAKMAFKEQNEESQVELAAFPYSSIEDSKVEVTEQELKAKYEEMKSRFVQYVESRDVKYIDIAVTASKEDRAELQKQFEGYLAELKEAADPSEVVRKSTSLVPYSGIPVTKKAFSLDVANKVDSLAVGATSDIMENKTDNTLNIVKLISKVQLPDSVEYRQIQVGGETVEAARKTADSIYTALKGGADFEAIAKVYNQTGQKMWVTSSQYENSPSFDKDTKDLLNTLSNTPAGELKNLELTQGNIVLQVVDRRNIVTKYLAAVVKKSIDFSKDTYNTAYNNFSSFISANQNPELFAENAQKSGYFVQERKDITTAEHALANIRGTREALKWVFDAKEGQLSPMYECGDNDHLLVVYLDRINRAGYRSLEDAQVKELVNAEVVKDKKAEQLLAKAKDVKSIEQAKAKGANVSTVEQITFSAPVFVAATGSSEPALSGAVSATAKGKFSTSPVKGNGGIYLYQVTNKTERPEKFDQKQQELTLHQKALQYAGNFMNDLYINAKVVDNRYLFF